MDKWLATLVVSIIAGIVVWWLTEGVARYGLGNLFAPPEPPAKPSTPSPQIADPAQTPYQGTVALTLKMDSLAPDQTVVGCLPRGEWKYARVAGADNDSPDYYRFMRPWDPGSVGIAFFDHGGAGGHPSLDLPYTGSAPDRYGSLLVKDPTTGILSITGQLIIISSKCEVIRVTPNVEWSRNPSLVFPRIARLTFVRE